MHVIGELEFGHGPQPHHGRAYRDAGNADLGNRCVHYSQRTKLALESLSRAEDATLLANILTHHDDGWIAVHLLVKRLVHGLHHRDSALSDQVSHHGRRLEAPDAPARP